MRLMKATRTTSRRALKGVLAAAAPPLLLALVLAGCSSGDSTEAASEAPSPTPSESAEPSGGTGAATGSSFVVGRGNPAGKYTVQEPITRTCVITMDQKGNVDVDVQVTGASSDLISAGDPVTLQFTSGSPIVTLKKGWKVTSECGPLVPAG